MLAGNVERCSGRDDHKDRHDVGEDTPEISIGALWSIMATRHSFLDQRALLEELHVRRNRRAHQTNDDENVIGLPANLGNDGTLCDSYPSRMAHKPDYRICE